MSFKDFQLDERIQKGLEAAGYQTATPIQSAAIPEALAGHDVIGTAQTGTGKTAAFVLPTLHRLLQKKSPGPGMMRALVVTPTRELADQIQQVVTALGKFTPIRSAAVYGGVGMQPQEKALRRGTELIVACPGRLLDHVQRGSAKLDRVEILILDEADRMLDMGFLPSIQQILKWVPAVRQTLLFSATFDSAMEQLISKATRQPKRISVGTVKPAHTVAHALYPVPHHLKANLLLRLLREQQASSVLVFTRTKHRADRLEEKLARSGLASAALHSNKSQSQRQNAMTQFRSGKVKVLVATDIAARGLDIASVSHVVNYDIPDSATTYIHRIGRTGRAERTGDALTLVTPEDHSMVREIESALGKPIEKRKVDGFNYSEAAPAGSKSHPHGTQARPAAKIGYRFSGGPAGRYAR